MKDSSPGDIWQHPCRKYHFLVTLPRFLRYIEPLFFSAARDLALESSFTDRELEALFVTSCGLVTPDLNLISDSERRPPTTGKANIVYEDWFTAPLLDDHAKPIRPQTRRALHLQCLEAAARARAALSKGQGDLVREESIWRRASTAFRGGDFCRAYLLLKRGGRNRVRERKEETAELLPLLAGLMLCLVQVHREFESSMRKAEQSAPKNWDAFQDFAQKYERSSIPLVRRYVSEALCFMTIGKNEDSVEAFRIFRRMLRLSPFDTYAGPHAMRHCLARRTHFKLAQKIYPTLRRMSDTDALRAGFRKWSREMTTNARN